MTTQHIRRISWGVNRAAAVKASAERDLLMRASLEKHRIDCEHVWGNRHRYHKSHIIDFSTYGLEHYIGLDCDVRD